MNSMTCRMSILLTAGLATHLCLHATALASTRDPAHIVGTYSDIRYIEEAGDVVGTEINITFNGTSYQASLEIAQGSAGDPITPSEIKVDGKRISFSIPQSFGYTGEFTGKIENGMLTGAFVFTDGRSQMVFLRKQKEPKKSRARLGIS
jgi:hypothetical protein